MRTLKINGKEVIDATENMVIRVTRRDVKKGTRKNVMTCAVAHGILHDHHVVSARVGPYVALVEMRKNIRRFSVGHEDRRRIDAFDKAGYFQPGIVTLVPPRRKLGIGTRGHYKKGGKKKNPNKSIYLQAPVRHVRRVA